ncbi:MAG: PQQ-binding-like beta-propeller repeat protein [Vicinamibacterales bacterium]
MTGLQRPLTTGLVCSVLFGAGVTSQQSAVTALYRADQAAAGQSQYQASCGACHGSDLSGTANAPPLAGTDFVNAWSSRSTLDLLEYMRSAMPPTSPGSLGDRSYGDIAAYILQANGAAAGADRFVASASMTFGSLGLSGQRVQMTARAASAPAPAEAIPPPPEDSGVNRQADGLRPVTDADLLSPPEGDWLSWRRTLDGWGYSPLKSMNTSNVHQLQLAWSWGLGPGDSQPTPLVRDGIMFVPHALGVVQALDAATGEFIWEYRKSFATPPTFLTMMRNLAIYGDRLFVATHDAHLVALDARTGRVVWDREVADYQLGYRYTSGPIVVKGKIIAGMTGCDRYKNDVCFVSAHDPRTGNELWRTSTIAKPGEPGGDSWGDRPVTFRAGGDAWIPGGYDPATDLIFWSTAQAKPWARAQRGGTGNELYTNSTLALNPETGKIVWYHQFIPADSHDQDEAYESILVDHRGRQSIFKMGKLGILWELDRKTGKYLSGTDLGYQTIFELDRSNGQLIYQPGMLQQIGQQINYCPSVHGMKNWRAMAYHPAVQAFYVPMFLNCESASFPEVERKEGGGGNGRTSGAKQSAHPASQGKTGQFLAMDLAGRVLWRHQTRAPMASAALTTAGGLAIVGDSDRFLYVHDARSGKVLYQTRLPSAVQGFPITYSAGGVQYLAVPVGTGPASWIGIGARLTQTKPPPPVNAIFVFRLPEAH